MDWSSFNPNIRLAKSQYGNKCGLLWDGYQFEKIIPEGHPTNGSLAGYTAEFSTFPVYGYNGYYVLQTLDDDDPVQGRQYVMWCGEIYSFFQHLCPCTGAELRFLKLPFNPLDIVSILMRRHFISIMFPMPVSVYNVIPLLRLGEFCAETGYGGMIMQNIYVHENLMFLHSFDLPTWISISISCLLLGCVLPIMGTVRVKSFHRLKKRYQESIRGIVRVFFALFGLLFGQGGSIELYNRWLTGLWLLSSTIVVGCLQGSMRDLMRLAIQTIEPETYSDLMEPSFSNHLVVTADVLPGWQTLKHDYPETLKHLNESDRLILFKLGDIIGNPRGTLNRWSEFLLGDRLHTFIFIGIRRLCWVFMWGALIYRESLERWTGIRLGLSPQETHEFFTRRMDTFFTEFTFTASVGSHPFFFPFMKQTPQRIIQVLNGFIIGIREYGFISNGLEKGDGRLRDHFSKLWRTPTSYHQLIMDEIYGPLFLYGVTLLMSIAAIKLELLIRKSRRLKEAIRQSNSSVTPSI